MLLSDQPSIHNTWHFLCNAGLLSQLTMKFKFVQSIIKTICKFCWIPKKKCKKIIIMEYYNNNNWEKPIKGPI